MWHIRGYRFGLAVAIVALLLHGPTSSDGRMSSSVETVCSSFSSSSSSSCTQRLMIEMEVHGDDVSLLDTHKYERSRKHT